MKRKTKLYSALGAYNNNAFILEIPITNKCIQNEKLIIDNNTVDDLSTFLHEYFHYLINVSTFVRFRDIYAEYFIKALFSHTMNPVGYSDGSNKLNKEKKDTLDELFSLQKLYDGDYLEEDFEDFKVTNIELKNHNFIINSGPVTYNEVILHFSYIFQDSTNHSKLSFGNIIFEESLCKLIEESTLNPSLEDLPNIPYKVIDAIIRYYDIKISSEALSYIALMSLLTTAAPYSFIKAIEEIKNNQASNISSWYDDNFLITHFKNEFSIIFGDIYPSLIQSIDEIIKLYDGREGSYFAIKHYGQILKDNLIRRKNNICFDLDILFSTVNISKSINDLLSINYPCVLLLLDEVNRTTIFAFENKKYKGISIIDLTVIYGNEQSFVSKHIDGNKLVDSNSINTFCPNYSFCEYSLRSNNSDICRKKPWKSYKTDCTCYYNFAVSGIMGKYKINANK